LSTGHRAKGKGQNTVKAVATMPVLRNVRRLRLRSSYRLSVKSFGFFTLPLYAAETSAVTAAISRLLFCVLSSLLFALCTMFFASYSYGATPEEDYKKIQKDIKKQKEKLRKFEKRERSILADIEKTNKELSAVEVELRRYKERRRSIESEIAKVTAEISISRSVIEKHREWIKSKLKAMQKHGESGDIVMVFSSTDDVSQLMRGLKNLEYVVLYEHRVMNHYKDNLKGLSERERYLAMLRHELIENERKVRDRERALAEKKREKEQALAYARKEKASHEKMLRELQEASKRLLEIIRESEKTDTYTARGFGGLKARLPWPVEGKIALNYGYQRDPQFNTPLFRNGIYIQTGSNLVAKAVHSGKIVFAEWFKGYGQLMIVNHGDGYHTLYGSLSEIFHRVGDIIKKGQVIGRVGSSGIMNEPGLYFELRYKGKPLDPLQWLEKR